LLKALGEKGSRFRIRAQKAVSQIKVVFEGERKTEKTGQGLLFGVEDRRSEGSQEDVVNHPRK